MVGIASMWWVVLACCGWYKPVVGVASLWWVLQACGGCCKPVVGGASLWWVLQACGGWCKPVVGGASLWWVVQACSGWCNATASMYKPAHMLQMKTGVLTTEGIYRHFKVDADSVKCTYAETQISLGMFSQMCAAHDTNALFIACTCWRVATHCPH